MTLSTKSAGGVLLVGLACLAWGAYRICETHRFLGRSVRAIGTVFYASEDESNRMLVEIRGADGRVERSLPVHTAWWTPFWRDLRGDEVAVVFDPRGNYDALLLGDEGRIDSWAQLWGGAAFWCGLGGLILAAGIWARLAGARLGLSASVEAGAPDEKG